MKKRVEKKKTQTTGGGSGGSPGQDQIRWMQDGENTKNENEACAIMLGFPEHIESMTEWKSQYI